MRFEKCSLKMTDSDTGCRLCCNLVGIDSKLADPTRSAKPPESPLGLGSGRWQVCRSPFAAEHGRFQLRQSAAHLACGPFRVAIQSISVRFTPLPGRFPRDAKPNWMAQPT